MSAEKMQFDYIVVGSGTSGCVVANRLSANPAVSVCLIEAGARDNTPLVHIPSMVGTLLFHKKHSWGYTTVPQEQLGGRRILLPRGKILGGCSSTNGMVYFRGHPQDFDEWANELGCPGWSFREVLPYFTRSENNDDYRDSPWHGTEGEMHVSHVRQYSPMNKPLLTATSDLGYPRCEDFNGCHDPAGFDVRQNAIHKGRRVSSVTAFINPVRNRKNLTILTDCFVNRVVLDNNVATGVEVQINGSKRLLQANKEVVVSGGAYGSPALLMHSGIGDVEHLQSVGIEVKHHLPAVGQNLHDHPSSVVQMETGNSESYGISWKTLPRNAWSLLQYLFARKGQLAGNLFEVTGFLRTEENLDRPDVQFVFMPASRPTPGFPFPVGHGFGINSILLRPKSRGSVKLAGNNPQESPLIDNNFLGDSDDIEPLMRGIRLSRQILGHPAMGKYQAKEILPGPAIDADDELRDYIRSMCSAVHHPGGSCRMGSDESSVVDLELKVRGIDRLRVVDASVFPKVVSGNTNAPAVMVAEKASDIMLGKPRLSPVDL